MKPRVRLPNRKRDLTGTSTGIYFHDHEGHAGHGAGTRIVLFYEDMKLSSMLWFKTLWLSVPKLPGAVIHAVATGMSSYHYI